MTANGNIAIVLTGSFNPPTIAHMALIRHALDAAGAGKGILVPSNDKYVARKMRRHPGAAAFSEDDRIRMLEAMATKDPRLEIMDLERDDDGHGHTYDVMLKAREACGLECMFLLGADKLRVLPRWYEIDAFLRDFRFAVASRGDIDAEAMIRKDPKLSRHADRFEIIPELPGMEAVSSTEFRKLFAAGDPKAAELVDPDVYAIVKDLRKRP